MTFDCLAFMESTTNDGLLPVAPAAGQPHGFLVAGDDMQMKYAGRVLAGLYISAAVANFVQARDGVQDDPDLKWNETQTFCRDQTGGHINPMEYNMPFGLNALYNVDFDHGNNAQIAALIFIVSDGNPLLWFDERPWSIPNNARWVVATGVTAGIASTWVEDLVTYTFTHNQNKNYDVYGIRAQSTTGYGFRIHPQDEPKKYRPGWVMGDTKLLAQTLYSDKPMFTYSGRTPPTFDKLCSGTDSTATRYEMLVVER